MAKRMGEVAWWLAAVAAGVLLALALLLIAWSVHKPWLPGYLDLRLREVWLADTFASAVASFLLALNLGAARRGQYHWDVVGVGVLSTLGVLFLCAIILPVLRQAGNTPAPARTSRAEICKARIGKAATLPMRTCATQISQVRICDLLSSRVPI